MVADKLFWKYKKSMNHEVSDEDIIATCQKLDYYAKQLTPQRIEAIKAACLCYWQDRYLQEVHVPGSLRKERIYLDRKMRDQALCCIKSLNTHPDIARLLHPMGTFEDPINMNEAAIFFDDVATDLDTGKSKVLKIKGKLDNFTIDTETNSIVLNDLKTTGHRLDQFSDSIEKWHYKRQFGLYAFMVKEYAKKYHNVEPESLTVNLLVVSTLDPYESGVYKLTAQQIQDGWNEFTHLLKLAAEVELERD